jgi:hypothetical protein
MRIHPMPHHPTLSSFLSSPTIHLIHKVISKTRSFNPRGSSLLQRPVCVVHLEHVHIEETKGVYASKGALDDQSLDLISPQQALVNFHFLMK